MFLLPRMTTPLLFVWLRPTPGWNGVYLRVEACPDHHPAEVSEPVLPAYYEQWLVEVWVILSQLLFLHFPWRGNWCTVRLRERLPSRNESRNTAGPPTFSFPLAPFFPGSSLFHCLLFVHFYISLYWNARNTIKGAYKNGRFFWRPEKITERNTFILTYIFLMATVILAEVFWGICFLLKGIF